jgi:hypothetical protein
MNARPTSIMLLGGLAILGGVLNFLAGWFLMLGGTIGSTFGASIGIPVLIIGTLMFAAGLASLMVGYGLWRGRSWAWPGAMVVFGTNLFIDLCSVLFAGVNPLDLVVSVGISVVAIWFLLQPATRAVFRPAQAQAPAPTSTPAQTPSA